MMKMEAGQPKYFEWIKDNLPGGSVIGVDEDQIPAASFKARQEYFKKHDIQLVAAGSNLVDEVWGADKPGMPHEKVYVLDDKYTGQSVQSKYKDIAKEMPEGVDMMLVTTLDDIAWMLNLRGNDIEYNPLFFSYVLFHKNGEDHRVDLFVDADKISDPAVADHLKNNNISVFGYDEVSNKLKEYAGTLENKKISIDKNQCNQRLFALLEEMKFDVQA